MFNREPKLKRARGNTLVVIVLATCFIVIPSLVLMSAFGIAFVDQAKIQHAVQAAGLLAANDVSRIVINDDNFGYVSLSNYPPIGKGTIAADGEPLPVTSINSLVAGVRHNSILANELGNDTMRRLARSDRDALDSTIETINRMLRASLSDNNPDRRWVDLNGETVQPLSDVKRFLAANLPSYAKVEKVELKNGWLANGGRTIIDAPHPDNLAQLPLNASQQGKYKAFLNVPVGSTPFQFAGVGSSSSLVESDEFRDADEKHISSIIRLECVVTIDNPSHPMRLLGRNEATKLNAIVCCEPFSLQGSGPAGVMTVKFSGKPVPGLQSWNDFLSHDSFIDRKVVEYGAIGGDYPTDRGAQLHAVSLDTTTAGTSDQFAEHLYYWLRSAHGKMDMNSVIAMVNAPFEKIPNAVYAYEFGQDGNVSRRVISKDPFPVGVTAESQVSTVSDTQTRSGQSPIIIFRDNVKHLGTANGGKHAGQPLAGNPLNWCELSEYGGDDWIALGLGKGKKATGLTLIDTSAASIQQSTPSGTSSWFNSADGKKIAMQPRKSFYSGGLALDIEIGGIKESSASADVERMRKLSR